MPQKIIIDTDPGVDDAMAILFAHLAPEIELIGLTTIFGNVSVEQATINALRLVDRMGVQIPVAQGEAQPLEKIRRDFPDFVHGKDGFGDIGLEAPVSRPHSQSAVDFLIEQVMSQPGEITIVAIGPLTNLALAAQKHPLITQNIKELVLMGGAATVNGNVNPVAEANIISDPKAADIVFTSDWPRTMVGLDVTEKVLMDESYLKQVHSGAPLGKFILQVAQFYLDFHISTGVNGLYTHDPAAIAYVIEPELFTTEAGEIRVVQDGIAEGLTIMNRKAKAYKDNPWSGVPKTNVCLDVDSDRLLAVYREVMRGR
jgi:inosine-uridine nucleoside N-ribohydrolase